MNAEVDSAEILPPWSGATLRGDVLAALPLGRERPPLMQAVAVASEHECLLVIPGQLSAFLEAHSDRTFLVDDVGRLRRQVHSTRRPDAPGLDSKLRRLIEEGRCIDVSIADALDRLADGEPFAVEQSFLIYDANGATETAASIGEKFFGGTGQDARQHVSMLIRNWLRAMVDHYRVACTTYRQCTGASLQEAAMTQMKGAFAVAKHERMNLNGTRLAKFRDQWTKEVDVLIRRLSGPLGRLSLDAKGYLKCDTHCLREFLHRCELADSWERPIADLERNRDLEIKSDHWLIHAQFNQGVHDWVRLETVLELRRLTQETSITFEATQLPRQQPRLKTTTLNELIDSQLVVGPSNLFLIRFVDLELCCLAEVQAQGRSLYHLGDALKGSRSPQKSLCDRLAPSTERPDLACTRQRWEAKAEAALLVGSLGLGARALQTRLNAGNIQVSLQGARELKSLSESFFPELKWHSEELLRRLAVRLQTPPDQVRAIVERLGASAVAEALAGEEPAALQSLLALSPTAMRALSFGNHRKLLHSSTSLGPRRRGTAPLVPLTAPHLDLADDVRKVISYELTAAGLQIAIATPQQLLVQGPEEPSFVKHVLNSAQIAGQRLLSKTQVPVALHTQSYPA